MGSFENDLNLEATELRLGLPGTEDSEKGNGFRSNNKRPLSDSESRQDRGEEGPKAASSPKYVLFIVSENGCSTFSPPLFLLRPKDLFLWD